MELNIIYDFFDGDKPLPNGLCPKYHEGFWADDHNAYNVLTRFIPMQDTRMGFFQLLLERSGRQFRILSPDNLPLQGLNIFPVELNYSDRSLVLENCFAQISESSLAAIRQSKMKLLVYYGFEAFSIDQAHWIHLVERSLGVLGIPPEHTIFVFGCENLLQNVRSYYENQTPYWNWKCLNWLHFSHFEFEFSHYLNFVKERPALAKKELVAHVESEKTPTKKFLCLNGGGREHRVFFLKELFRRKLNTHGHISYLKKFLGGDQTREFVDSFDPEQSKILRFHESFTLDPLYLDTPKAFDEWHNRGMSAWTYEDSWFTVVTETLYQPDSVFLTEKSFKPIANLHPFLLVGFTGALETLRDLGYKTFSPWFDESYDHEKSHALRFRKVLKEVERLCNLSDDAWGQMLDEMTPTLEHNRNLLFSKQFGEQINTLFNQIESISREPNRSLQDLERFLKVREGSKNALAKTSYDGPGGLWSVAKRRLGSFTEGLWN